MFVTGLDGVVVVVVVVVLVVVVVAAVDFGVVAVSSSHTH